MVLDFFRGGGDAQLEQIEAQIRQMLVDDRHTFDTAINALIGGTDPELVRKDIHKSDRRVNKAERAVRRQLVVHVSVRGTSADITLVLASMSVVKDAERIGDYSKNIWDIANSGIDLSDAEDIGVLMRHRDRISTLIGETARVFGDKDLEAAHNLLRGGDDLQAEYDELIDEQLRTDRPAREAVPRALLYRYYKRIAAHLLNILTSLVMPIDRLDYYDEDKADRE
ncbi:MAG: PhoU domain-containing protein [Acidimicrobiia bacterium]|nr:PhoU domain-containing protein [Acidimicrobiia bacterium]